MSLLSTTWRQVQPQKQNRSGAPWLAATTCRKSANSFTAYLISTPVSLKPASPCCCISTRFILAECCLFRLTHRFLIKPQESESPACWVFSYWSHVLKGVVNPCSRHDIDREVTVRVDIFADQFSGRAQWIYAQNHQQPRRSSF